MWVICHDIFFLSGFVMLWQYWLLLYINHRQCPKPKWTYHLLCFTAFCTTAWLFSLLPASFRFTWDPFVQKVVSQFTIIDVVHISVDTRVCIFYPDCSQFHCTTKDTISSFIARVNVNNKNMNYRPERSCGKVMFSQASVILFTCLHGVCVADPPPLPPPRDGYYSERYVSYWKAFLF